MSLTSSQFVQQKLQAWALRHGIALQGSAGDRGALNYVCRVDDSVFGGRLHPDVQAAFDEGAGGELKGEVPSFWALHSSAALAVNLFQYWVERADPESAARLLAVPTRDIESARFEDQFPVCEDAETRGFLRPPHLDFALRYQTGERVGVECKLHEPYGRLEAKALASKYLDLPGVWDDIPAWRALAEQLASPRQDEARLGASQLVKHVLGLKYGTSAARVRLVYLYFDAPGDEAAAHRAELEALAQRVESDPVRLQVLSVQEFIGRAVRTLRADHQAYVDYLSDRYL